MKLQTIYERVGKKHVFLSWFVFLKKNALMSSKAWESFVKHRQLVFWKKLSTIEVFSRCQMVTRLHSCCSESMLKYSNRQNAQLGGSPQIHTMCIRETLKIKCFIDYIFHKFLINLILYCMVDYFLVLGRLQCHYERKYRQ